MPSVPATTASLLGGSIAVLAVAIKIIPSHIYLNMEITLKGNPQSTNHIYKSTCRGKFASVYMSATGKTLKEDYRWQIKSQYKGKPLTGDLDLRVELFFGDKRVRDIDNYNKLLLDACTGILWVDDSQIQSLLIVKNYDKKNPRIEITL